MPEYIENPRRAPRTPVRCDARVALGDGGFFAAATIDVGRGGCQVPTPTPLNPGARVFLELAHSNTPVPFRSSGRVAWARSGPAPRAGIAFDDASAAPAARLYGHVAEATPEVAPVRAPDRLSVEAELAPAPPPSPVPGLTPEEALVLAAVGDGVTLGALRARLAARWGDAVNATFGLLGRGLLLIGPPDAAAGAAWKPLLEPR
jgi:hypothetical protein